jgi:hypothetical protein
LRCASAAANPSRPPITSTCWTIAAAGSRRRRSRWPGSTPCCPPRCPSQPRLQPLIDDDDAFFATNALLLRNPSLVNLLDGCALSLPCHREGEWPVGLMVWGPALADDRVLAIALALEAALAGGR